VTTRVTRSRLLVGAAAGGAALAAGWPAPPAAAAPSEQDLAWLRFAVTLEFVSREYYRRARRTGIFRGDEARALERATGAEVAHMNRFRTALTDAGESAIDLADLEVVFPDGAFTTRAAAASLGRRIEALSLHAYLGAVTAIRDEAVRRLFAQVSASESAQLTYLTGLVAPVLGDPFPSVHGLPTAAEELAAYLP
jgi:Ferritin-like domain